MSSLRFLLDENLSPVIKRELLNLEPGLVILRVGDDNAPLLGTSDEAILEWLQESGFILVTDNRKSMPGHLRNHYERGGHHHGILAVRRGTSLGQIIVTAQKSCNRHQYTPVFLRCGAILARKRDAHKTGRSGYSCPPAA